MTQDDIRANFLSALDRADVDVTTWEAGFLESCLDRFNFTPKQRIAIDKMMAKYEDEIGFNAEKGQSLAARAADEEKRLKLDINRCVARAKATLMPDQSMAVTLYMETKAKLGLGDGTAQAATRAKLDTLWKHLLASEREAITKAGNDPKPQARFIVRAGGKKA